MSTWEVIQTQAAELLLHNRGECVGAHNYKQSHTHKCPGGSGSMKRRQKHGIDASNQYLLGVIVLSVPLKGLQWLFTNCCWLPGNSWGTH